MVEKIIQCKVATDNQIQFKDAQKYELEMHILFEITDWLHQVEKYSTFTTDLKTLMCLLLVCQFATFPLLCFPPPKKKSEAEPECHQSEWMNE